MKNITYIDCDGVILDSETYMFDELKRIHKTNNLTEEQKCEYIQSVNWYRILSECDVIGNSLEILKSLDPRYYKILTKVHTLYNEGYNKIKFFRDNGIKLDVILVPYKISKNEVVNPIGNILIDDTVLNCDNWKKAGGKAIFFNKNNTLNDKWGVVNSLHETIIKLKDVIN